MNDPIKMVIFTNNLEMLDRYGFIGVRASGKPINPNFKLSYSDGKSNEHKTQTS